MAPLARASLLEERCFWRAALGLIAGRTQGSPFQGRSREISSNHNCRGQNGPAAFTRWSPRPTRALGLPVPQVFNIKFLQGGTAPAKPVSDDDFWSRTEASHVSKLRSGEKTKLGQIALALRRKDTETNGVQNLAHATTCSHTASPSMSSCPPSGKSKKRGRRASQCLSPSSGWPSGLRRQ